MAVRSVAVPTPISLPSLDALLQLAFQLAFYRIKYQHPQVYENIPLCHFYKGRTETLRASSKYSRRFVSEFYSTGQNIVVSPSKAEYLVSILKAAMRYHKIQHKEASSGLGFDRHLFSLLRMRDEALPLEAHPFFDIEHNAFSKSSKWDIYASGLTGDHNIGFSVGPVEGTGFGVGYTLSPSNFSITVTSFSSNPHQMANGIEHAFLELFRLNEMTAKGKG